jgi:hypothetical protein
MPNIVRSSPKSETPQEAIQSRQQDDKEIYFVLGANLDASEFFDRWEKLGQIKEKIGSVCFRLRFIDAIQYESRFTEIEDRVQANALQVYLLCTCFDTLSGQSPYQRFDDWIIERDESALLEQIGSAPSSAETISWYKRTTKRLYEEYLANHGVTRNFRNLFIDLPEVLQRELVNSYAIVKAGEANDDWSKMPIERRLRRIVNYLFARRNKFTHQSEVAPTAQPTPGVSGWVHFYATEFDHKQYNIFITNSDGVRSETSLLTLVLIGIMRNLLGYSVEDHFQNLYWAIEKIRRNFQRILRELYSHTSLRSWYLSNPPINLAQAPAAHRLYYFRVDAIDTLIKDPRIDLSWFFGELNAEFNKDVRQDLEIYSGLLQKVNKLIMKYESISRKPRARDKTKIDAYEKVCEALRNIEIINANESLMTSFYYVAEGAPQIPETYYRPHAEEQTSPAQAKHPKRQASVSRRQKSRGLL